MARVFQLLRFFSVTGLVGIALTAVLLTLLYRELLIQQTVQLSQRSNVDLAQSLLSSVRSDLSDYLASVEQVGAGEIAAQKLSSRVLDLFRNVIRETSVVRIKLYNERGVVVYSTDPAQIGVEQNYNAGIISAGNGKVAGGFAYRGAENAFEHEVQEDNLVETYVPVRASPSDRVRGVFEIYTEATPLLSQSHRTVTAALVGAVFILLCLYAGLLIAVRRARNIIDAQNRTIRERTEVLEKVSVELLKTHEAEKHKLSTGLHESLAQTLSAIKVRIEQNLDRTSPDRVNRPLESVIPALQDAIREVRTIATDLRPPSLDELGLLPTIEWFCREVELQRPGLNIETELSHVEARLPDLVKIVIYRLIESALKTMPANPNAERIRLSLRMVRQLVVLVIEELCKVSSQDSSAKSATGGDLLSRFEGMQERASVSGGMISAMRNETGGTTLRATWEL